jgi:hypothetical protein
MSVRIEKRINKMFCIMIFKLLIKLSKKYYNRNISLINNLQQSEFFSLDMSVSELKKLIRAGVKFYDIGFGSRNSIINVNIKVFRDITQNLFYEIKENEVKYYYIHNDNTYVNLSNYHKLYDYYIILCKQ